MGKTEQQIATDRMADAEMALDSAEICLAEGDVWGALRQLSDAAAAIYATKEQLERISRDALEKALAEVHDSTNDA